MQGNTPKDNTRDDTIKNPGKGQRTPSLWGRWLTSLGGLNRQILQALTGKEHAAPGSVYYGTVPRATILKRRAKAKAGRKANVQRRMHANGKR